MNITDYIFNTIYKGSLKGGASERSAKDSAVVGIEMWKKGKFKKASQLIEDQIKSAKQLKVK